MAHANDGMTLTQAINARCSVRSYASKNLAERIDPSVRLRQAVAPMTGWVGRISNHSSRSNLPRDRSGPKAVF